MSRAQALSIVKKIDGKVSQKSLTDFASFIDIKEEELISTINSFVNKKYF